MNAKLHFATRKKTKKKMLVFLQTFDIASLHGCAWRWHKDILVAQRSIDLHSNCVYFKSSVS